MKDHFRIDTRPVAREESVLRGEKYRISILTPWLIRLEYSESGRFEDPPDPVCVEPGVSGGAV